HAPLREAVAIMTLTYTYDTPHGTLIIAPGRVEDVATLADIGEDVMAWQRTQGIDPGRLPRPLLEIVAARVRAGGIYLATLDGKPAGTVTILDEPEGVWDDLPGKALSIHGLMVRRAFAGQEIGQMLLRWAEQRAAELGLPLLRLDCDATNPALRSYYERTGFTPMGNVALAHRTAARYQKWVEEGVNAAAPL